MAGDWIKMRADLFTHPKVVRISSALKADTLRTVGALMSVWCIFDAHSEDGKLEGYELETLDMHLRWEGFAEQMMAVGWIEQDCKSLILPRFDTHNGQSAKRRAQDADRKKELRKTSACEADKKRTREEKRREEEKALSSPKADDVPFAEIVGLYHDLLPTLPRVKVLTDTRKRMLKARWHEDEKRQTLDFWERYFKYVGQHPFLIGENDRGWQADFEWLITLSNFVKVIEGGFERRAQA